MFHACTNNSSFFLLLLRCTTKIQPKKKKYVKIMTLGCPHNIGYDYYVEQITKYIV